MVISSHHLMPTCFFPWKPNAALHRRRGHRHGPQPPHPTPRRPVQALVGRWTWHGPAPWGSLLPSSPRPPQADRIMPQGPPPGRTRPRSPRLPATRRVPPGAPHAGHALLGPTHAAPPRRSAAERPQAWRAGRSPRARDTGTPHGRRAAALLPRCAQALEDASPGSGRPQAGPRLTPGPRAPPGMAACRAVARRHALVEPRPACGGALCLGATPAQGGQNLLTWAGSSAVFPPAPQAPNNRLTGSFSWINPYRRQFFLIKCCHRGLSGIFSVIITATRVLLGVCQECPARHRPDAWSIVLSSVRV